MANLQHDWIPLHKQYFLQTSMPQGSAVLKKGQIVTFQYNGEQHWVLIVDPHWHDKVHALNLKYVPRRVLLRILNEALPTLTEHQFYTQHINKPYVTELGVPNVRPDEDQQLPRDHVQPHPARE